MENNIDLLQIKIEKARAILPQKSREAIDVANWKIIILGMLGKYSPIQLDNLETETELLLCGLVSPQDYPNELETRMHLSKEEVASLIEEMDKLVFKKIQKELERKINNEEKTPYPNKTTALDPRFSSLPKEIQESIAKSNYQVALYTIGGKYKIKVEQLGSLEEITIKLILGEIHPEQYEGELASKITISKEDLSNLIKDVNENILKKIREGEKKITNDGEIPLPPYAKIINNEELIIKNEKEETKPITPTEDEIPLPPHKVINNEELIIKNEKGNQPIVGISDTPLNIIEEKLKGVTVSDRTVSDHSLPKIKTMSDIKKNDLNPGAKTHDPYREPF